MVCWPVPHPRRLEFPYLLRMNRKEILIALTTGDSVAVATSGASSKKNDFYLDPASEAQVAHLPLHGPNERV